MESGSNNSAATGTAEESPSSSDATPEFDPSLSEEERRFYLKAYPNVDLVRERKVHCTICKIHIGTAPSQEINIKMHPVLRVTHCTKCHDFYNSGEFSKGEDGSELYCRWCGQGGEVYCCSNCPYVFCKSCIVKNLSRGVVADIEQNENWNCFSCAPKILWPLRAQHWALINYIEKQKKSIQAMSVSEYEKKTLLSQDRTTCCRLAKAKCGNMSDSMESLESTASRRSHGSGAITKKPLKQLPSPAAVPAAKRQKTSNDEVVCTPDLLSMLEPDCQITMSPKIRTIQPPSSATPKVISIQSGYSQLHSTPKNNTPPPLVLRNTGIPIRHQSPVPVVRRTIIGPRTPATISNVNNAPVYHTINGYRIDLNSAAQQETFRLPNGKLIQVKRQGAMPNSNATVNPNNNSWSQQQQQQQLQLQQQPRTALPLQHLGNRPIQITPAAPQAQHYITLQQNNSTTGHNTHQISQQHPQVVRYHNTTVTPVSQNGTQIQLINGAPPAPTINVPATVKAPLMVRHVFPNTAIGQARTQLQDQVFNAMEICQHLTGKVQTLTNSNAYKQARNYLEVKELYIHLSYLLTYAIGRFKGLQDKCLGDMRQLGFVTDADSLENGQLAADKQASDDEDNEIEIVEPKTDTITLDSDNDDEPSTNSSTCLTGSMIANSQSSALEPMTGIVSSTIAKNSRSGNESGNNASVSSSISTLTEHQSNNECRNVDENELAYSTHSFLASLLEVDMNENEQSIRQTSSPGDSSDSTMQKKQPRKKTTSKPNPTLLKQKEMLERERLEEIKRNDLKLKMKCTVELRKAEEEYPIAKQILEGKFNALSSAKGVNDSRNNSDDEASSKDKLIAEVSNMSAEEPVEIVAVLDLNSSVEDVKSSENEGGNTPSPSSSKSTEKVVVKIVEYNADKSVTKDDEDKEIVIEVLRNSISECVSDKQCTKNTQEISTINAPSEDAENEVKIYERKEHQIKVDNNETNIEITPNRKNGIPQDITPVLSNNSRVILFEDIEMLDTQNNANNSIGTDQTDNSTNNTADEIEQIEVVNVASVTNTNQICKNPEETENVSAETLKSNTGTSKENTVMDLTDTNDVMLTDDAEIDVDKEINELLHGQRGVADIETNENPSDALNANSEDKQTKTPASSPDLLTEINELLEKQQNVAA